LHKLFSSYKNALILFNRSEKHSEAGRFLSEKEVFQIFIDESGWDGYNSF